MRTLYDMNEVVRPEKCVRHKDKQVSDAIEGTQTRNMHVT